MYFLDLSSYTYLGLGNDRNLLAVGWLDAEHQFVKGSVPHRLLTVVLALCFEPVNQTRGFHQSPFLNPSPAGYPVEYKRQKCFWVPLGSEFPEKLARLMALQI